jgi:hypothetical protein
MAEGTLTNLAEDQHVWLAVEVGDLLWPKEQISSRDQHWTEQIYEGGTSSRFSLVLLMVDRAANKKIEAWIDQCEREGSWPGLANLPGSSRLHVVRGLTLA